MSNFDQNFENTRLAMLTKQYPEIVKADGEVVFCAEGDENRLSGTAIFNPVVQIAAFKQPGYCAQLPAICQG